MQPNTMQRMPNGTLSAACFGATGLPPASAFAKTGRHPMPPGLTSSQNSRRRWSSVGRVRNVTSNHDAVVIATIRMNFMSPADRSPDKSPIAASSPGRYFGVMTCKNTETTKDTIRAVSSLKALMRHQNQRRINSRPVPAPTDSRILKSCSAFCSCRAKIAVSTMSTTVEIRPTHTSRFSEASGRMKR